MNDAILSLTDIRATDTAIAGGKGANLGELAAHGFPVPPAFVIASSVSRLVFQHAGIDSEIQQLDDRSTPDISRRIQQRIVECDLPDAIGGAILDAHAELIRGRGPQCVCAVRSSATAEDLAGASFAGQHGTYYYVERPRLLEMVRRCWASLWSPEAIRYRSTHGIAHRSVSMAVVVQEMVLSDISGVSFTANPVNGARSEIVVEASWGMGAALVDGRVTPDRFVVARESRALQLRIAEKRVMIQPRLSEGSDARLVPVPAELQRRQTLRLDQIQAVVDWSLKCEAHFGTPQDVEWAIADGQFFLLQSRPITTLARGKPDEMPDGQWVLFKAMAENFTGPLTPYTADLLTAAAPPVFRMIAGRPYLDLRRLRPFIPLEMSDRLLAELLYLRGTPTSVRWSVRRLPLALATALFSWLGLGVFLARTRGLPDDFMQGYRAICDRVAADEAMTPVQALMRLWLSPHLFSPVGHMVLHVNGSFIRVAPWLEILKALLRRWLVELPAEAVSLLCSGSDGVLSAQMGRAVAVLAHEARAIPAVAEIFRQSTGEDALDRLRQHPEAAPFLASLDRFLAVHGHRALKEFELRTPRWSENPAPVIGMIRNYVVSPVDPLIDHEKSKHAREELEGVIKSALEGHSLERLLRIRWRVVRGAAERVRYYLKLRENSRFFHIMGLGAIRRRLLAIEADLLRRGQLKCRDDIFFLRITEVDALSAGRLQWVDVEERIRERRIEHVRFSKMTPPMTIGIALASDASASARAELHGELRRDLAEAASGREGGPVLSGQSASPGRYVGRARVILDPAVDATLEPGEVLVAPYTDPAWTPLFLTAGAAVVEVGSYLSHAGTVAREYGMPCVVDVTECTQRVTTGMWLDVDADRGTVTIIEKEAAA